MRIGVDLGTTRTLAAAVDRGNYPVVGFLDAAGDAHEHFPSVVALRGRDLVFGFEALAAAADGAPLVRSFKRALASPEVSGDDLVPIGDAQVRLLDLLVGFLRSLRHAIVKGSNAPRRKSDDVLEAVIAVPAHAHGAQRYLTLEAFRRAGFDVRAMINEPSAAGFEYTHRQAKTVTSRRTRVVVYDLGGGTFDASLVRVDGVRHDVLGTAGLNRLGGDDFDLVLLRAALAAAGIEEAALGPAARRALLEQCREAKERLTPQSRRIALDVSLGAHLGAHLGADPGGGLGEDPEAGMVQATVPVEAFYEAAAPLVARTVEAMRPLLGMLEGGMLEGGAPAAPAAAADRQDDALSEIAGIYLVGGGSGLPLVPRILKETFGRRVHRSPHPAASTAIGLAIAADEDAGFSLADRLSRGFGVFRDRQAGRAVHFDPIFTPESALPERASSASPATSSAAAVVSRRYRAAHNVGWFRFVECARIDAAGEPRGDLVPFAEVLFPFDPALRGRADLRDIRVERRGEGPEIEERYTIDAHGLVEVEIACLETGYRQRHRIGG
jgi:molecular chaperone DnaK (HSP70)